MFDLIKSIVWIAGILVVTYFVMGYFGYTVNKDYFANRKEACKERIKDCANSAIHNGVDNIQCDVNCVNPELIIKKK